MLREADLPILMKVLSKAAHHTFLLGVQLGLDPNLVLTQENQASNYPTRFLCLVLTQWLKRLSPPATLTTLVNAISEPPIGDEGLGCDLQQAFTKPSA